MQFSKFTLSIVLVALLGTAKAYPTPQSEVGCVTLDATTRSPFCTPV